MKTPELDQALKASGTSAAVSHITQLGKGLWGDVYDHGDDTALKVVRDEAGIDRGLDLWEAGFVAWMRLEKCRARRSTTI